MSSLNTIKRLILEEQEKQNLLKEYQVLTEAPLSRVIGEYFNIGFIIVSADRTCQAEKGSDCSPEEIAKQKQTNIENEKQIKQDIKAAKFGFVPVLGGYREKTKDKYGNEVFVDNPSMEKSFIVPAQHIASEKKRDDYQELKKLGLYLIKKYNQDSFLFKPPAEVDKAAYFINKSNDVDLTLQNVAVNDLAQTYFTKLQKKPNKRFSLTEELVIFVPRPPNSMGEAICRYGEIFYRFV